MFAGFEETIIEPRIGSPLAAICLRFFNDIALYTTIWVRFYSLRVSRMHPRNSEIKQINARRLAVAVASVDR
jgi:hypothetical protein